MRTIKFIFLALLLVLVCSCRNVKNITYFQDISDNQLIASSISHTPTYKLRGNDNLYVSIKTVDPEVNQLFSPAGQVGGYMTGTQQMYGDQVSQYINGYQVDSLGNITLPILGKIKISGLTIDEARKKIQTVSLEYLQNPVVDVKILSFRVNVSGEVKDPGIYYNYQGSLNVLEALSLANGITDNADIKEILVLREKGDYTETFKLDLTHKDFINSEGFYLNPYDIIYVKPSSNKKIDLNIQTYQLFLTTITTIAGLTFLYQPFQFNN
ncbi:polysaccharide biosynthesis/export family protein [Saccharicrinis sp. FJH2]|uniref:polysaccharide biosynthesis/export family protein n=1 Tax=Saccharicrinis sp. FJH65 TaxID=3344659 RepID=UPI0035F36071